MPTDELLTLLLELGRKISVLTERVETLESKNAELRAENAELRAKNVELQKLLHQQGEQKSAKAPSFRENYSVDKNQGEAKSKRGQKATGRRPQSEKLGFVQGYVQVYEAGVSKTACVERRVQYGWRFIEGQARYVCYHIYALPESKQLPEVVGLRNGRSEYGLELILTVAFLHYWSGLSLDHVCGVVAFFTGLALSKSQANALLNQLSAD